MVYHRFSKFYGNLRVYSIPFFSDTHLILKESEQGMVRCFQEDICRTRDTIISNALTLCELRCRLLMTTTMMMYQYIDHDNNEKLYVNIM